MLQRFKDRRAAGEGGFTLIELLVVIIILGILAAVVVFAVGGITDKGNTSACKIDTRTLRTAQEAYAARPGGDGKYGTEAQLVPGFLSEESSMHNIRLLPDAATATDFDILVAGPPGDGVEKKCGSADGVVGTPGNI